MPVIPPWVAGAGVGGAAGGLAAHAGIHGGLGNVVPGFAGYFGGDYDLAYQLMDALNVPGDYFRGLLSGTPGERVGGRELLENIGMIGPNSPDWELGDFLGFGASVFTDPLNLALGVLPGGIFGGMKSARAYPELIGRRALQTDLASAATTKNLAKELMEQELRGQAAVAVKPPISATDELVNARIAQELPGIKPNMTAYDIEQMYGPVIGPKMNQQRVSQTLSGVDPMADVSRSYHPAIVEELGEGLTMPKTFNRTNRNVARMLEEVNLGRARPDLGGTQNTIPFESWSGNMPSIAHGPGGALRLNDMASESPLLQLIRQGDITAPLPGARPPTPTIGARTSSFPTIESAFPQSPLVEQMIPMRGEYARMGGMPLDEALLAAGNQEAHLAKTLSQYNSPDIWERILMGLGY